MTKISKAKRAHLLARMGVEECRQGGDRFMRCVCAKPQRWATLPNGYRVEVIALDSQGGSFAAFQEQIEAARHEIAMILLGPEALRVGSVGLYSSPLPFKVTS